MLVPVDKLDGVRVVVQKAPLDLFAVGRHEPHEPIARLDLGLRVEQRLLDLDRASLDADPREVGPGARAERADPMAVRALALAFEQRFAACGVAALAGRRLLCGVRAQKRDEPLDLFLGRAAATAASLCSESRSR